MTTVRVGSTGRRVYMMGKLADGGFIARYQPINKKTGLPWQAMRMVPGADATHISMRDGSSVLVEGLVLKVYERYPLASGYRILFRSLDSALEAIRADARSRDESLEIDDGALRSIA